MGLASGCDLRLALVLVLLFLPSAAAAAAGLAAATQRFNYTRSPQSYTVPAGVNFLQVDACGARGGNGGYGGFISGIIPVTPGQLLWVYVGGGFVSGQPVSAKDYGYFTGPGGTNAFVKGYNGGGYGGYTNVGGGGTDIRTNFGGVDGSQNVPSRLVVAGGGGGYVYGGGGGGLLAQGGQNDQAYQFNGGGGSQGGGGAGSAACTSSKYSKNGGLWQGGACVNGYDGGGPGGGGGYYGGGSGGNQYGGMGGGGGGSSFFTPTGFLLRNVQGQCPGPHGSLNITASLSPPAITAAQDAGKLCDFLRTLSASSTGALTGWCLGPGPWDPCSGAAGGGGDWPGVGCGTVNGVLRVTNLALAKNSLSGSLSASLGGLGVLTALNLSGNSLGGNLPSELGALNALTLLALNSNNFTAAVPSSFCRFSSSAVLALQANPHLSCLPACLLASSSSSSSSSSSFPKLERDATLKQCGSAAEDGAALCTMYPPSVYQYMWPLCKSPPPYDPCSGNWESVTCSLVGGIQRVTSVLIPLTRGIGATPVVDSLTALTALQMNVYGGMPVGLWSLVSLRSLALRVSSTLSSEIGNLAALTNLDLSMGITGSLPTALWSLTKLQQLILSQNKVTGELSTLIGKLTSLTYLDMSVTSMAGTIPTTLSALVNLQHLSLYSNHFTGQTFPSAMTQLSKLQTINLQGCGLVGSLPPSIGDMSALTVLNLLSNSLIGTLPSSIGQLKRISSLQLAANKFTGAIPTQICTLPKYAVIFLKWNPGFACMPKCLNSTSFPSLDAGISGFCTMPPTPFPTAVPTLPPTGTSADFVRQTTLSRFTVTQTFTCVGNAATCVSIELYAPVLLAVNNELWMDFADQQTRWLTADMLTTAVSVVFNPNIGSDVRGYLLSYDYSFRPADLQMSTMAAVQASFKRAVAGVGVAAYTLALTAARKASDGALSELHTLNCTSLDIGEATPAPPRASSANSVVNLPASPLAELFNSAQLDLGLGAVVALFYSVVIYLLRRGVQQQNEGVVVAFKHFEFVIPLVLSISAATSNILQIRTYLASPATTDIAAVMIVCRVGVALYSAVLLAMTLTRPVYSKHLVGTLLHRGLLWVLVAFAALLDPTHLRYFPWKSSEFAERSRGFPTLHFFKVAMGCTAANALVQLSVSVAKGISFSAISSLVLSLVLFVSTVFTIAIKLVAEKIQEHDLTLLPVATDLDGALKIIEGKNDEIAALQEEIAKLRRGGGGGGEERPSTSGIAMVSLANAAANAAAKHSASTITTTTSSSNTTTTRTPKRLTAAVHFSDVYNPALLDDHVSSAGAGRTSAKELDALRATSHHQKDPIPPAG